MPSTDRPSARKVSSADSSGFGLISVRGMSTLLNNVEIDGADDNQAYFSEERGRTREGYSTSSNAVQELIYMDGVSVLPAMSCGLALYPDDVDSASDLMRLADAGLGDANLGDASLADAGEPA